MTIADEGMKLLESDVRARFFSHEDNGKSYSKNVSKSQECVRLELAKPIKVIYVDSRVELYA